MDGDNSFDPTKAAIQLEELIKDFQANKFGTMEPFVHLFNIKGKPISYQDHRPFRPFFEIPAYGNMLFKTGRQLGKTEAQALAVILRSLLSPGFSTLCVAPLFEHIRRFSSNYVRPRMGDSAIRSLLLGPNTENSVLQKTLKNGSKIVFSYASVDAERIRGASADALLIDELQNMDPALLDIIIEVLGATKHPIVNLTGTPLGFDNLIQKKWSGSSQAEWFIKCEACGHWNIPSTEFDLLKMLGEVHRPESIGEISEANPAIVCAKPSCRRPVHPMKNGRWVHRYPDRVLTSAGFHVPQPIMPIHYGTEKKWAQLKAKEEGTQVSANTFHNEVLGESYDTGARLVTLADLQNACVLPWENNFKRPAQEIFARLDDYKDRVLAIDWGGGGEKGMSYTVLAVLGLDYRGDTDVLWACKLLTPNNHELEASECLRWFRTFKCNRVAHDYTGAGSLRETFMIQAGFDERLMFSASYIGAAQGPIVKWVRPTEHNPHSYYRVDKTRSLLYTCQAIKHKKLKFFRYDNKGELNPGLIEHFTALTENKQTTKGRGDIYQIFRDARQEDDFAQAVNIGLICAWHSNQAWPNFGASIMGTNQGNMDIIGE